MTAYSPDQFDELLEGWRIRITDCVKDLFRLDPSGGQRLDNAISSLNTSMIVTLGQLRTGGEEVQSTDLSASEFRHDCLTSLGFAFDNNPAVDFEDSEFEQYLHPLSSDENGLPMNSTSDSSHTATTAGNALDSRACGSLTGKSQKSPINFSTVARGDTELSGQSHEYNLATSFKRTLRVAHARKGKTITNQRPRSYDGSRTMKALLSNLVGDGDGDGDGDGAVAGTAVFREFCDAVKFVRCQKLPRLPPKDDSIQNFLVFFSAVKGAEFACHLLDRVGSWRFLRQYYRLMGQKKEERRKLSRSEDRSRKAGKSASQARSILMMTVSSVTQSSDLSAQQNIEKGANQLDNRIEASKVWYAMCQLAGPALAGMIPAIPRTKLQRMRIENREVLLSTILKARGELERVVKTISPHLEAILEGRRCLLGPLIENSRLKSFEDVFNHGRELAQCDHLSSCSAE